MTLVFQNRIGIKFVVSTICQEPNKCKVSTLNNSSKSIVVSCSQQNFYERWTKWGRGEYLQKAFNNLNADEREFLLSGTISEE